MRIPRFPWKPVFWCIALIALVEFALLFLSSPIPRSAWRVLRMGTFIFDSPTQMEPAPFWHYGRKASEGFDTCLIAHAGGAIEGTTYTNSREALQNSKKLGFRFVELDLQVLADGTIVGAHDAPSADLQTWENFSAQPVKGKFTPIALPEIRDFFRSNPDMWLVTDRIGFDDKQELEKFLEVWGEDRGHLIVEVFSPSKWLYARKLGIRLPALRVDCKLELKALRFFNIPMATCTSRLVEECPHDAEEYLKAGGSLLVFTVNDAFFAKQNFSHRATLFYTDYITPANEANSERRDEK